jgi:DNA mismatch repair protein MutS
MSQPDPLDLEPATVPVAARTAPETFESILFVGGAEVPGEVAAPVHFRDLNLDQVVEAIVAGRDEYELRPFFHLPLREVDAVEYRHEVFNDLESDEVDGAVTAFAGEMARMRRYLTLAHKQHYKYEKERWYLDAVSVYCDAVTAFSDTLAGLEVASRGLRALRGHVADYVASPRFATLASTVRNVLDGLDRITYTLRINGGRVTVSTYEDEADYSVEVEKTFARFQQGAVEDHLVKVADPGSMDYVEARIAELVARLYPAEFKALDEFCSEHATFADEVIVRFDREVQFYLAYLQFASRLIKAGLSICYPEVSVTAKEAAVCDAFDISLASKLTGQGDRVVVNDFALHGVERILVVTGPNQGGKSTFARMFGQLHYLAALGVPVPGSQARLFLPDHVFTHFERQEDISTLRGKLDDELVRVKEILERATGDSVIVLNEIFASTTLADAVFLGSEVLRRIVDLDCLAVCVTFVDDLSSLAPATVSVVAGVAPDDPTNRTFKIERRPADGRAYAGALAEKYGLSYDHLRGRIEG